MLHDWHRSVEDGGTAAAEEEGGVGVPVVQSEYGLAVAIDPEFCSGRPRFSVVSGQGMPSTRRRHCQRLSCDQDHQQQASLR